MKDRALWAKHLALKDALSTASFKGEAGQTQRLEKKLMLLESRIFTHWRKRKKDPNPPAERFAYKIPLIEVELDRLKGYLVADQDGIHRIEALQDPLPPNDSRCLWLKVLDPSKAVRERAARTWHAKGHTGRPQCPGCRGRKDLTYLEFHNGEETDRLKVFPVLAVCDKTVLNLLVRSRREIFGVTALGSRVPWPCLEAAESATPVYEEPLETQPVGPGRGGWRGKPGSLAALFRNRVGGSAHKGHSLSVKPAFGGPPCNYTRKSVPKDDPANGTAPKSAS